MNLSNVSGLVHSLRRLSVAWYFRKIVELSVKFMGEARVRWSETTSTGKTTYTRVYTNRQSYFERVIPLWGTGYS